ncbi:sodium bile acid symporter family protein [Rhizodiscina lignyota]|uniref:Sodium bile acid symporter family protein n=1 Tax=Rhizodiscina lignyota TaxID=1504668 RepID=A0A9P4IHG0_9PEZI|nr:sodium bile acid symporter family protein [Rhizodiscina lignyota]
MSSKETAQPSRVQKIKSTLIWILKDQWFVIGLGIVILIASQVQVPASRQRIKTLTISYLAPGIVFFITGCTLSTRTLIENYSRWKLHLFVQIQCFLVTSALGFAIVCAASTNKHFMDPWLLIGLIINASLPTTIASNVVMTRQANGNTALTVVQTTVGCFLGVFISPLLVKMYVSANQWYTVVLPSEGSGIGSLYRRTTMQLGLTVYVPMFVGQILRNLFEEQITKLANKYKINKLNSLALLTLVWQTFDSAFETRAFESVAASNMIFIVFISIGNWLLWLVVSFVTAYFWMDRKSVVSICYCVPAKTLTVGVPLSTLLWTNLTLVDEAKLQVPMVIFQAFQVFLSSLLTIPLRKWVVGKATEGECQSSDVPPDSKATETKEGVIAESNATQEKTLV